MKSVSDLTSLIFLRGYTLMMLSDNIGIFSRASYSKSAVSFWKEQTKID
jgi:hypothetical protein